VAITFDDGYLDTLECAAPLLERNALPATVFATTRWLEDCGEYWWDVLEGALLHGSVPSSLVLDVEHSAHALRTDTAEARRAAHDLLHGRLVHLSLEARDHVVQQLVQWSGRSPDRHRRPLLADELQQLARVPGISIGAHTVNHLALPVQSPGEQERELVDSLRALERLVPYRVGTFAFPYGAVDGSSAALARAHCRWSMSCDTRVVSAAFDAARVPRLEVKRWNREALARKLDTLFTAPLRRQPSGPGA
jgi:peptidoglycan/xylan/chitin deacetylase (PgdA/CDA1 family)